MLTMIWYRRYGLATNWVSVTFLQRHCKAQDRAPRGGFCHCGVALPGSRLAEGSMADDTWLAFVPYLSECV